MRPPPGVASDATSGRFGVLVVGGMNLCRSAAAERLLRAGLDEAPGADTIDVASAGTHAALEQPMPEPLVELLEAAGAPSDGHTPRELTTELVQDADLVLTASREERAEVVRRVPAALRRTFTLPELARVARSLGPEALPDGDALERLRALVGTAGPQRGRTAPLDPVEDDVPDPFGRDRRAYESTFEELRAAVGAVVATVRPMPGPGSDEPPVVVPPRPAVRRRRRWRDVALVVLASLVVLVVTVTTASLVALDRLDDRIERFPDPFAGLPSRPAPAEPVVPAGEPVAEPVTILVLGSADDVGSGPEAWAAAAEVTDVVLLARVAADRESAQVVALPPDLAVGDPAAGADATLRSAFADGGPAGAVQAIEQVTDVRVDHVALTDAATFARLTDALGGVDLAVPEAVVAGGRVVVPAGEHRLSGEQALLLVHGAGDEGSRPLRALAWLEAILDRVADDDVRGNPTSWPLLLDVVSGSVAVDEGFDRATMVGLLASLRQLRPGDVDVVAAPTSGTADGEDGLVPDAAPFAALMEALRTDTVGEHVDSLETSG